MNRFNREWLSIVLITSVMSCCVQVYGAAVQENEDILADDVLLTRGKFIRHVRHVPILRRDKNFNLITTSTVSYLGNLESWQREQILRDNEILKSAEVDFSEEDDENATLTLTVPVSTTVQSVQVRNHSSVSLELETNSSDSLSLNVLDSSETPSQNKIQRGIPVENAEKVVVIDTEKDKVFDENESEGSSKLWIYSNAICILLVVGVSIFLIYYPKKDRRKACKDSSESSSSTSSASSTA